MDIAPPRSTLSELPAWSLRDARSRLSALMKDAREHGPQRVTVGGQDAVIVLSAEDYARLVPETPVQSLPVLTLYDAMMRGPFADVDGFDEILDELRGGAPAGDPVDLGE